MTDARAGLPRPEAARPTPARSAPAARTPRPDPRPLRLMLGFAGIVSASAIATGLLPTVVPTAQPTGDATVASVTQPEASVQHVVRYVQLQPGQTPPPQANVIAAPKPSPRRVVVTTTRQSGKP